MTLKNELSVLKALVYYRLYSIKSKFLDKFINMTIWVAGTILVMGYLMQSFGLAENFGVFQFAGIAGIIGIFEVWEMAVDLLVDIENDNLFAYHASLACSLPTVLFSYVLGQVIVTVVLSFFILPIGKIVLWSQFALTNISWIALKGMILCACLFFAIFALLVSSIIRSMEKMGNIWIRIIWPMWFFGGFQFSYSSVLSKWPIFAYFLLLNPVTYATEGIRSAILGGDYLNPWLCMGVLLLCSVGLFFDSVRRYRNWLDLV